MDRLIAAAVPVFLLSIAVELAVSRRRRRPSYERRDTLASLAMGLGAVAVGVPFRLLFLGVLAALYQHRLFTLRWGPWTYLALLLTEDLCYYWSHRANHEVRLLWAGHVNHHSSQFYNLSTALRQSWTQPYMMWIWWLPLPLLGFKPEWVLLQQAVSLIYQFFIHTEQVGRLGPLEWVLNTPSHHRVHHAVNTPYLDRNHGGIFIVWDRLFGTFVAEREDEPCVYGITKRIHTFNPLRIAFHEWRDMLMDVHRAPGWQNKLAALLRPPGWSWDGSSLTTAQLRAACRRGDDTGAPRNTEEAATG